MPAFEPLELAGFRRWAHAILTHRRGREIYQTSTMGALLSGVYEGDVTIRELLRHGDFGLGTFNCLDGEMLVLDGVCYQLRSDGSATIADAEERTPFAAVTWFRPERRIDISVPCDRAKLKTLIDQTLESINLMVAVRVTGQFSSIHTRTVAAQHPPYRPFTEATQDQQEVTFTDVSGTLAGFRMPDYEQGIAVAGYHSHFIDTDRRRGGHTLDYRLVSGTVEIGIRSELHLSLQRTAQFLGAELDHEDLDGQIRQTEGG
ncbi:acetolactate decarboxylase [Mycobacterium szulgai]|uniref:Alpha-acetolactate decarboxylase n=1 Tax=Mycobacterium szulgai TaxID=1787 RepID=A0A1X2F7P5_MYCSZ|nr:acetolactate decarboxylase [Mycobacterium szulgai]MCV7078662.1 acetolactate decarboxylase [Mycobacterium szulgai]ORX14388.1 alpha-acetolactate decarboxylase [Mycobacterium szulgai]